MSNDASDSDTLQPPTPRKHQAQKLKGRGLANATPKCQDGWKPRSLTAPVLIPIASLSLLIAAGIEILAQRSRINGGLALAPTPDGIPQYAMLSYLYLPTIIAVIFSLIWNWVDLDVKRMQPWFELSKPEGATAKDSLFLDYPYDFAGLVPFKAAKRRHWPVFLSSTVVVAIFWLVTPLQSSILGTSTISRVETVSLSTRSKLLPLEEQNSPINPQILTTGYSIGWLGQDFPAFTTASYATLPFYVENDPGHAKSKTNWTATTTKFSTELECWPAEVSQPSNHYFTSFLNGQGCNTTFALVFAERLFMAYAGYNPSDRIDITLGMLGDCPPTANLTHQFLAIWAEHPPAPLGTNYSVSTTALYCQPHYYKQQVSISVAADNNFRPDDESIVALSPREKLTEQEFNSTAFEYVIANGVSPQKAKQDYPFSQPLDLLQKLDKSDLSRPISNMVGYALAGLNEPADAYKDPKKLQEAYNRAHQYLFSAAISFLLVNETNFSNRTATSSYALTGIVVSRPISAAVEALLVVATVCILALLWVCSSSPSNLRSNPSSISRYVHIFQGSQNLNQLFFSVDCADDKSLSQLFPDDRFRLSRNTDGGAQTPALERISGGTLHEVKGLLDAPRGYYKPFRPVALRRVSGIIFVLIQIGAIVTVSCLKLQETKQGGLVRPSDNFEVLQLLENFIPTIFATLTEPCLVLLNRFLCVLQPFKALSKGRSMASKSLDITYASIPPQLVIWRAIKRRHFLLVIICIVALLSNVLAVGLSALFKESPITTSYPQGFRRIIASGFNDTALTDLQQTVGGRLVTSALYADHMYVTLANISLGTALPPWTTSRYFFQPHIVDSTETETETVSNNSSKYVVSSRGFGIKPNCEPIAPFVNATETELNWNDCTGIVTWLKNNLRNYHGESDVFGSTAFETNMGGMEGIACENQVAFGWGRQDIISESEQGVVSGSGILCSPVFQTAMFNVTHDKSGRVISYQRTSDIVDTMDHAFLTNQSNHLIIEFNGYFGGQNTGPPRTDKISQDWMDYLLVVSTGSRDALDPTKPPPEPGHLIPTVEDIYQRLFAVYLSLNPWIFETDESDTVVVGSRFEEETRIFMAGPAYIMTVAILGLNVVAAVMFYSTGPVSTLPRMPTSIGSMLAYVASSRMVQEDKLRDNDEGTEEKERTYSFGRYIGVDNKTHLGIDVDPHVALIDPDSIKEKKPWLAALRFRRWRGKRMSVRNGTWI